MGRPDNQAIQTQGSAKVQEVYNQYGSMLYGYLLKVLKNKQQAEQCLVSIFDDISTRLNETGECGPYTWCGLYRLAKAKLINHINEDSSAEDNDLMVYALGNRMYEDMTDEQKQVFQETYYRGKMITQLSQQLNKPEPTIRKTLMEAFNILRRRED